MRMRPAAVALLAATALTGCAVPAAAPSEPDQAATLWAARTPYAGDGSRVTDLLHTLIPAAEATYTVRLQTVKTPYALTIEMQRLGKPFADTDFSEQATLALGLIDNLDRVSVTSSGEAYSLTAEAASRELGYDVKELGRNRARLTTYLRARSD